MRILLIALALLCFAPERAQSEAPLLPSGKPLSRLSAREAVVLGVVEGVTEFLPISSTGHLILATHFLYLDGEQPLFDEAGEPIWYRKATERDPGELLTLDLATESYIVVIQFGAVVAIIPICWSQLMLIFRGIFRRDPAGRRLFMNLFIAFLPSAVLGLLLHDWVDDNLFSIGAVIFALIAGALLMFFADRLPRFFAEQHAYRDELNPGSAAMIGFMQCLAMWPGTSRPMMTIVGGYFAGLRPGPAAGFSFLLGFVTVGTATIYKAYQSGEIIIQIFGWQNVLLGIAVAAITAFVSARFFIKLLLEKGLSPFAWYRLALAAYLILAF